MITRNSLTPTDVESLRSDVARRLEALGIESQPEVAMRVLELSNDPKARLKDYAEVIRTDAALSGRLLKLANSAYFAQRVSVTSLERACLLMGIDRLRAIALGFHLSRAAGTDKGSKLAREVWGQSVLRACLAGELARKTAPALVSEAFVIGLMIDAGVGLMRRLAGAEYVELLEKRMSPAAMAHAEGDSLALTHVDVIVSLSRVWRLPELLGYPLEHHHTPPMDGARTESVHRLHRIAFAVGVLDLWNRGEPGEATPARAGRAGIPAASASVVTPGVPALRKVLGLEEGDVREIIERAMREYRDTIAVFADIADAMEVDDELLERLHVGLATAVERVVLEGLDSGEVGEEGNRVSVRGQRVEIERAASGRLVAYLYDSRGQRLIAHSFDPGAETGASLAEVLGLEVREGRDVGELEGLLRRFAA